MKKHSSPVRTSVVSRGRGVWGTLLVTVLVIYILCQAPGVTAQGPGTSAAAAGDNECERNVCQNDAYCENRNGSYVCVCQQGWTGTNCDQDVDECKQAPSPCPDVNDGCVNSNGSFSCVCNDGYERLRPGDVCKVKVILPYNNSKATKYKENNKLFGPFYIPGGFMLGGTPVVLYYISDNGYIAFNSRFTQPFMPRINSSRLDFQSFVAPYWTDIDLRHGSEESGLYHMTLSLADTYNDAETKALFDEYKALPELSNFDPVFISVVTWVDVLPYNAWDFVGLEPAATFQVVMATDGRNLKGRVGWRTTWPDTERFRVQAYLRLLPDPPRSWMPLTDTPKIAPFSSSQSQRSSVRPCVEWLSTRGPAFTNKTLQIFYSFFYCPCSLAQILDDPLFTTASSTNTKHCLVSQVFSSYTGWKISCCYRPSDGVMLKGHTEVPIPEFRDVDLNTQATDGYSKCCEVSHPMMCGKFRQFIPIKKCSNGIMPLETALVWGNGHFITLGDLMFTYNGWNEYLLLRYGTPGSPFLVPLEVQGRSQKANVQGFNSTVFTAFAVQYGNATPFEVHVNNGQLKLYRNGQETSAAAIGTQDAVLHMTDNKAVLDLVFSIGVTIKVTASLSHLSLSLRSLAIPVWTGLLSRNLTFTNHTSEEVFDRANIWSLSENQSIFTYSQQGGDSFSSYQHPDFVPTFLPSTAEELLSELNKTNKMAEGRSVCGEGVACLQDFLVTGSEDRARETKKTEDDFMKMADLRKQQPPVIPEEPEMWPVWRPGSTLERSLGIYSSASGPDPNVTVTTETVPSDVSLNYTIEGEKYLEFVWYVDDAVKNLTSASLTFVATNPLNGITVEYKPGLVVCACDINGQCDWNAAKRRIQAVGSPYGGFEFMDCKCNDYTSGRFCRDKINVCESCYDVKMCDLSGILCRCPEGYYGDGKSCYEVDECLRANKCQQVCVNTVGSYTCSCNSGYTLLKGGRCEDIDECRTHTHTCGATQVCENTVGSFVCQCRPGFGGDDCLQAVKHRYRGHLSFSDLPSQDQGWTDDLRRVDSAAFTKLGGKIKSVMSYRLGSRNISYVGILVFDFRHSTPVRQRRSTGQQTPMISATFEVTTAQQEDVTSLQGTILSGFDPSCTSSLCRLFGRPGDRNDVLYGVDKANLGFQADYDLCSSDRTNDCHNTTTLCVTVNATSYCQCRPGYRRWDLYDNICLDEDECQTNSTEALCGISSNTTECRNTDGSYYCLCPASFRWDADHMKCVEVTLKDVCGQMQPCQNGAECVNTMDQARYACRCTDGWTGLNCADEDAEAKRFRHATIGVAVTLGVLCFIIIIVVIVCVIRRGRSYSLD